MELITILNRCHRFRGFVYQHAHFSADKKSIEVAVRPRKGSAAVCSRCHLPAPGYDQLAERRFEFIPLWGFLVFLLYTMRRVNCRRCGIVAVEEVPWGDGKRTLTKAHMLFLTRWARRLSWKETASDEPKRKSPVTLVRDRAKWLIDDLRDLFAGEAECHQTKPHQHNRAGLRDTTNDQASSVDIDRQSTNIVTIGARGT